MQELILAELGRHGFLGVALLMFLQNLVPVLPSEVIMPLAGFLVSRGYLNLHGVIAAGLIGSILGHLPWYFLGVSLGREKIEEWAARYGCWICLRRHHVRKSEAWFEDHAVRAVLLGRLVPGVRTYVNIPAGVARMSFLPFLACTMAGEGAWTALLASGGYLLGRDHHLIASFMHVFICVLIGAGAFWALWRRLRPPSRQRMGLTP